MANFRKSVIAALIAAGVTATTDEGQIKREYFKAAKGPLSKAQLPDLLLALGGDTTNVIDDAEAEAKKQLASAGKTPKAPKEPKAPRAAAAPKTVETPEAALARLKADPATSARWARVQEVLEMGKRGPIRVRIVCDDKGPNGETLTRDIKVQDLFQVRFSAGYKKSKGNQNKPAPTTEQATQAA